MLSGPGVSSSDISIDFSGFLVREFDLLLVGVMRERSLTTSYPFDDLEFSDTAAVVVPVSTDEVFTVFSRSSGSSGGEAGRLKSCTVCDWDEECCCVEDCGLEDCCVDREDSASGAGACVTDAGCSPDFPKPPV